MFRRLLFVLTQLTCLTLLGAASASASATLVYAGNNASPSNVSGIDGLSFVSGGSTYTYDVRFVVGTSYDALFSAAPPTFLNNSAAALHAADALAAALSSLGVTQIAGIVPFDGIGQTVDIPVSISQYGPYSGPDAFLASGSGAWTRSDFSVGPSTQVEPANWQSIAVFSNLRVVPVDSPVAEQAADGPLPVWALGSLVAAFLGIGRNARKRLRH